VLARVPFPHRLSSKSHSLCGRALLGGLLLSRVVALASGCGPKDGEEGGRCLSNGGCESGGLCDDSSLVCGNAKVCEKRAPEMPAPPPTPSPCDALLGETSCPAGWSKSCVNGTATPDPAWNGACVAGARDGQGTAVFCCDESRPTCTSGFGNLAPALVNTINWSNCPGAEYVCHDLPAPPIPDASIQCAVDLPDDAGRAALCCVSGDACFVLDGDLWGSATDTYYPRGACAPGEEEHFCTGNAALGDGPCRAMATPDGGASPTQAHAFCCPQSYVPTGADAGANAGSGEGEPDAPDSADGTVP
jgi:hypothetical protein